VQRPYSVIAQISAARDAAIKKFAKKEKPGA
jgi:hypothetical protein